MHVIERGDVQKRWSCEQKCSGAKHGDGGCGSLLCVEDEDLFPGLDGVVAFACPLCATWSALDDEAKIPANLAIRIPFRVQKGA